jgi:hypothetical protein
MTSFHHTFYESGIKDHPGQKEVKEFASCIKRLYPREPIEGFYWPVYTRQGELINKEVVRRNEMCRSYPFINTTRYLREHFRCPDCIYKSKHPNKEKVKNKTKFCEKCFNQNVKVKGFDFNINFLVNVIDDDNFSDLAKSFGFQIFKCDNSTNLQEVTNNFLNSNGYVLCEYTVE